MNGGIVERNDDVALFAAKRIKTEYVRDAEVRVTSAGAGKWKS